MTGTQQTLNKFFGVKSNTKDVPKSSSQKTLDFHVKSTTVTDNTSKANSDDSSSLKRSASEEPDTETSITKPVAKQRRTLIEDDEDTESMVKTGQEIDEEGSVSAGAKSTINQIDTEVTESKGPQPLENDEPESDSESTAEELMPISEIQKAVPKSGVELLEGKYLPYSLITETFDKIEATSSRLKITAFAAELFLEVLRTKPEDLSVVTYLCINRLGPDYEGLELGLGESLIIKSLAEATGRTLAQIKNDYKVLGDLGEIALKSRKNQPTMFKPKPLSINVVFKNLEEIARSTGTASQTKKIGIIKRMLTSCQGNEAKFLVRSLEGKLRIGLAEKSVLTGLAQAFVAWENEKSGKRATDVDVSNAEIIIRDVHCQIPNYGLIIQAAIENGISQVPETCKLTAGIPLKPMLAKPTKSVSEILDRFGNEEFTCEYKYDGERAQVHLQDDGKLKVYSRNMEDMSQRYPDLLSGSTKFAADGTSSYILDCEAVAWDREQKKILPFQVLSTRKRKDVDEGDIKVRICLFAFDLLYLNGRSLLKESLAERRRLLHENFTLIEGQFSFAKSMDANNVEEIQTFLDESVKDSCEGLMIKVLNGAESGYEPSKRSRNWLKLKKDYLAGVGDSLDLVVLGGYHGRGKRTNTYGAYLLGSYNSETEEYETICKIGTGFSDEMLDQLYKALSQTVTAKPKSYYSFDKSSNAQPDVWFEPTMVWEVLTADLSLSPIYKAGIDQLGKGISLRFPRFIRIRDDKGVEDATTSDQVVQFYQRQASVQNND